MMPITALYAISSMIARRLVSSLDVQRSVFYGGQVQAKRKRKTVVTFVFPTRGLPWGVERTALMSSVSFDVDIV